MVNTCYIPKTLEEALKIRKETGAVPLAGGTDLMVAYKRGVGITPVFPFPVMIITQLDELKGIKVEEDGTVVIGALTTSVEIAKDERVPYFVRLAASKMGAVSLRNTATIGGNIGNSSPKGDLPQPLILLDATVVLQSLDNTREMKVDDFIIKAKKNQLAEDEIIVAVRIPKPDYTYGYYRKIGTRRANAISKLTLSSIMKVENGVITDFRASSGAAGPKVARSREVEKMLIGKPIFELSSFIEEFVEAWDGVISPHAMPEFRRATTKNMLRHFLSVCADQPEPGIIE
ncbi:MAG: FAD binding domain-containing protein [Sphaerochaetaceae bacterium]|nr:FAD binding domain-containing protein [Sphaerochaetaceae bacterium]